MTHLTRSHEIGKRVRTGDWVDQVPRVAHASAGTTTEIELSDEDVRWSFDRVTDRMVDLVLGTTTENPSPAALGARVVEVLDGLYRSAAGGRFEAVSRD